jgi:DNA-binding transcriptional regulator YiaG
MRSEKGGAKVYQYRESGLDYVFLKNGYRIRSTPYGKGVSIQDTAGLHKAIGRWIINQPHRLTGAELRFLRLEIEQTQRDLAGILGSKEQTLRLWEKARNKAMPATADRLLRALYADYVGGDGSVRAMLEHLARFNEIEPPVRAGFHETNKGWEPVKAPSLEEACACA